MVRRKYRNRLDLFVPDGATFSTSKGGTLAVPGRGGRIRKIKLKTLGKGAFAKAFATVGPKTPTAFSFVEEGTDYSKEIFAEICADHRSKHLPCMDRFGSYAEIGGGPSVRREHERLRSLQRKAERKWSTGGYNPEDFAIAQGFEHQADALEKRFGTFYDVYTMPVYEKFSSLPGNALARKQGYALQDCFDWAWSVHRRKHPGNSGPSHYQMEQDMQSFREEMIACAKQAHKKYRGEYGRGRGKYPKLPASLIRALELLHENVLNYGHAWTFEFPNRNMMVDKRGNLILLDVIFDMEALRKQGGPR